MATNVLRQSQTPASVKLIAGQRGIVMVGIQQKEGRSHVDRLQPAAEKSSPATTRSPNRPVRDAD